MHVSSKLIYIDFFQDSAEPTDIMDELLMSMTEPDEETDLEHPEERDDLRQVLLNRCNPSLMETLLIQKMARAGNKIFNFFMVSLTKYWINGSLSHSYYGEVIFISLQTYIVLILV